jgi:hypothetical protein
MRGDPEARQSSSPKSVHCAQSYDSRRELAKGVLAQHREVQLHALIDVFEISSGEVCDAPEALTHGVPVKEQRAGHGVHASVRAEEFLERAQLVALRALGQRTEHGPAERADLRGGPAEDEAVRSEILERGDLARPVERPPDPYGLLGMERREPDGPLRVPGTAQAYGHRRVTEPVGLFAPQGLGDAANIGIGQDAEHHRPRGRVSVAALLAEERYDVGSRSWIVRLSTLRPTPAGRRRACGTPRRRSS